ncbi:MAG: hypothetical protein AAF512_23055, partial [Pseudomonadota bacterium]
MKQTLRTGLALILCLTALPLYAVIRDGFDSNQLPRQDDLNLREADLGFTVNFLGTSYSSVFVNDNGNITLDITYQLGEAL